MIFLPDTTTFSDLMREHPKVDDHLASCASNDRVVICPTVRGEIRYGIERLPQSKRRQELEWKAANLFAVLPCEPVPETAGDYYARIKLDKIKGDILLFLGKRWGHGLTLHGTIAETESSARAVSRNPSGRSRDEQSSVGRCHER